MQQTTFVGFDGKRYDPKALHEGLYELRHDGRFWHISFPIAGEPGGRQIYRGRELPQAADHDRWVHDRPYPPAKKPASFA